MANILQSLKDKGIITPPKFVIPNTQYLVITGSMAYGVSSDNSDLDLVGFTIPPKDVIFPHLRGVIHGFGRQIQNFEQYQKHGAFDKSALGGKGQTYDMNVYNIVKYFTLCMENNPNMLDTLFVPRNCVILSTNIGEIVRENRKIFLHKGAYFRLKGYAYAQLKGISKSPNASSKRYDSIKKYGYDLKHAYHLVRLINQCEQLLIEGDMDLQRSKEQLKAIRRGEKTEEEIREYFALKEKQLEKLYNESDAIPYSPDEEKIKNLLLQCLEHHYGSLDKAIVHDNQAVRALNEIQEVLDRNQRILAQVKSKKNWWNKFIFWRK